MRLKQKKIFLILYIFPFLEQINLFLFYYNYFYSTFHDTDSR